MVSDVIKDADTRMGKAVVAVQQEFTTVRTGRASAAILDKVMVEAYGTQTPIMQLATIKSPEPQMLMIEPWDRSIMSAIEKAILASDLGLNPSNDGQVIRVPFPPLNEERRKELVKVCKQYAEEGRVAVRNIRRDAIEQLKRSEKEHEIGQDDLRRAESDVQKLTDSHVSEIDEQLKRKEQEIMEV